MSSEQISNIPSIFSRRTDVDLHAPQAGVHRYTLFKAQAAHRRPASAQQGLTMLHRFIIERDIPQIGSAERNQLQAAAARSNEVLAKLGPDIQWDHSYVAGDKTFCVYLAKDEAIIRKHAEMSGFPATKITAVRKMIDPTTEAG
jgi:Protein of unknown function (DUF4242)